MKIENMNENDIPAVTDLVSQLGYPSSEASVRERFKGICNSSDYAMFVARSETGRVIGFIQVNVETMSIATDEKTEVAALVIDAKERSRGVGADLLRRAEEWSQSKGIQLMRLRSNLKRVDAHRFYERNGYRIDKTSYVFTKAIGS